VVPAPLRPAEAKWAYDPYSEIAAWEARLDAIGHGARVEMDPAAALAIVRAATPAADAAVDPTDPLGIPAGTRVTVTPSDYAEVPVKGELVATTVRSVSIRREDPQVGTVAVHFPKIGDEIAPV